MVGLARCALVIGLRAAGVTTMARPIARPIAGLRSVMREQAPCVLAVRWQGPLQAWVQARCLAARSGPAAKLTLDECFDILGVDRGTALNVVRDRYYALVKAYHPDSSHPESNQAKFLQVIDAFRKVEEHIVVHGCAEGDGAEDDAFYSSAEAHEADGGDDSYKHKAAAHRQYLQNWDVGPGTIFERAKRSQQARLTRATDRIVEHRRQESLRETGKDETGVDVADGGQEATRKKDKEKSLDQLVEEQIQAAMKRGDFDNLEGTGKPLKRDETFGLDAFERNMNRTIKESGYLPAFVEIQKDIDRKCADIFGIIRRWCDKYPRDHGIALLQVEQLEPRDHEELREHVARVNKDIDHFNLAVPGMYTQKPRLSAQWFLNAVKRKD